jgi:hypothetical protein
VRIFKPQIHHMWFELILKTCQFTMPRIMITLLSSLPPSLYLYPLLYETAIHKEMRLPPSLHSIIIGNCHGKIIKLWLILMSKTNTEAR